MLGVFADERDDLDVLVGESCEVAELAASGVAVVQPAGVEGAAAGRLDAGDAASFGCDSVPEEVIA